MKIASVKLCIALLVATVLIISVGATSPRKIGHGTFSGHQDHGFLPRIWVIKKVLQPTKEQFSQIRELSEEVKGQIKLIRENGRVLRRKIRAELDREEPSPIRVGKLVMSGHQLRKQTQNIRLSFRKSFRSLLTPEQLENLDNLKSRFRGKGPYRGLQNHFWGDDDPSQKGRQKHRRTEDGKF